jgi:ectoine hydroxylase-related dioxygenase (phytanoyl-CoA dioxygenase family)
VADCDLAAFCDLVEQGTDLHDYPHADYVDQGVLVYGEKCGADVLVGSGRAELQAELVKALGAGPGIVVFKSAFTTDVVDRASAVYFDLIDRQKSSAVTTGDHFGAAGSNDRLWSAIEKLALVDPETFCDYFSNVVIALVSTAWLGPNYQIVSEPNLVNPGSKPQVGHRDYHLGLMDIDYASRFPAHVHRFSSALTLQAAVAHVDMPVEAGPTMYLPHSQKFEPGYLAVNLPEFQRTFEQKCSQLPLGKGDIVFFNPAVIHGAGANVTADVKRMANLLQVSSAFGRAAATVDTEHILSAIYPALRARHEADAGEVYVHNVLTAAAEGYPFPTNLDRDKPIDSLFPESQLDLAKRALNDGWEQDRLVTALAEQAKRRRSSLAE